MTEAIEKAPDTALDAMNTTLRRMHATPPKPHVKRETTVSTPDLTKRSGLVDASKRRTKSPSEKYHGG